MALILSTIISPIRAELVFSASLERKNPNSAPNQLSTVHLGLITKPHVKIVFKADFAHLQECQRSMRTISATQGRFVRKNRTPAWERHAQRGMNVTRILHSQFLVIEISIRVTKEKTLAINVHQAKAVWLLLDQESVINKARVGTASIVKIKNFANGVFFHEAPVYPVFRQ